MIKILYGEDETELAQIVQGCLEYSGFSVDYCANGAEVLNNYKLSKPDVIVLDIMMPQLDGFNTALKIREKDQLTPIIFVTARTQTVDVLKGFELGANDYIKKPYSVEELIVRIKSLLRLNHKTEVKDQVIGNFIFDPEHTRLSFNGKTKKLSYRESELLRKLSENKNQIVRRKEVLEELWENETFFTGRSLDVFISRLRGYLKADPNVRIISIRKAGYMLVVHQNMQGFDLVKDSVPIVLPSH